MQHGLRYTLICCVTHPPRDVTDREELGTRAAVCKTKKRKEKYLVAIRLCAGTVHSFYVLMKRMSQSS